MQAELREELSGSDVIRSIRGEPKTEQIRVFQRLEWTGLKDAAAFDELERVVKKNHLERQGRSEINWMVWAVRALGFSGQEKYRATLARVEQDALHSKVRAYARLAGDELSQRGRWVEIINRDDDSTGLSGQNQKFASMLLSNQPGLQRIAAKRISFEHNGEPKLGVILKQQLNLAKDRKLDSLSADTYAWMAKAMVESGCSSNRDFLRELSRNFKDKKVRKHAKKASDNCS